MLSVFDLKLSLPCSGDFDAKMLYAIATHPDFQGRGFASELIGRCNDLLKENNCDFSVLVPASQSLFGYYHKLGYQEGFYINESVLSKNAAKTLCRGFNQRCCLAPAGAREYNALRNNLLKNTAFIKYSDEDIAYQKKLCAETGADIYAISCGEKFGCAAIERLNGGKIFIKELLLPDSHCLSAAGSVADMFCADEYIIRTPANTGAMLRGEVRPFAVYKTLNKSDFDITRGKIAYLGLAFD
jgi:hypothetical protein